MTTKKSNSFYYKGIALLNKAEKENNPIIKNRLFDKANTLIKKSTEIDNLLQLEFMV